MPTIIFKRDTGVVKREFRSLGESKAWPAGGGRRSEEQTTALPESQLGVPTVAGGAPQSCSWAGRCPVGEPYFIEG